MIHTLNLSTYLSACPVGDWVGGWDDIHGGCGAVRCGAVKQLTQQVAEMQREHRVAEQTVRQLRQELAAAQRDLASARSRDAAKLAGDDAKVHSLLQQIRKLDEELASAK